MNKTTVIAAASLVAVAGVSAIAGYIKGKNDNEPIDFVVNYEVYRDATGPIVNVNSTSPFSNKFIDLDCRIYDFAKEHSTTEEVMNRMRHNIQNNIVQFWMSKRATRRIVINAMHGENLSQHDEELLYKAAVKAVDISIEEDSSNA